MNVSVVGLGKLGLCTAACFASKGHSVIGVETNAKLVGELNERCCPVCEIGLAELLDSSWDNLEVTTDLADAVLRSGLTLIIVPTPSRPDGRFSNEYVEAVLRGIGPVLKAKDEFGVVDVVSTVMPGSCQGSFRPLLEGLSGKVCGREFGLVYNPEFIALGSVVRDFLRPDMVLIGASDEHSANLVRQAYLSTCENEPQIAIMSLLNAEITKLSLNCFVTMKISFVNELADICQRLCGADVDVVSGALGWDRRISPFYLRGGLSYGGTCFPRDVAAFIEFSKACSCETELARATHKTNNNHSRRLSELVLGEVSLAAERTVSVLGLAFKAGTPVITESPAIKLIDELLQNGVEVTVYDRLAMENARKLFGDRIQYADSVKDCISRSSVCVITTRQDEFKRIDETYISRSGVTIIDCWRILDAGRLGRKVKYVPLGRCALPPVLTAARDALKEIRIEAGVGPSGL